MTKYRSSHGGALEATAGSSGLSRGSTIIAISLVALSLRPAIVSVGNVLTKIIEEFQLTYTVASLLTALPPLLMGLLALPAPILARHFGRDRLLMASLGLLCAATALRSFSTGSFSFLASTGGIGAGIAVIGTLIPGFIKEQFATRASPFIGIYATCLSLGGLIAAATTGLITEKAHGDWRLALGIWSVTTVVAMIAWSSVSSPGRPQPALSANPQLAKLPLRDQKAWLIAAYFSSANFLFFGAVAWLSPIFQEAGYSSAAAGLLLSSFIGGFTFANPVFGFLSKSIDRRFWLCVCGVLAIIGFAAIPLADAAFWLIAVPIGALGLGGAFTLSMTMPLDNARSVEEANAWTAFSMTIGYIVAAAGPICLGMLRDLTGDFTAPSWLLVVFAVAMVLLSPFLKPISAIR